MNFSDNQFNFVPVGIEEPKVSPKAMIIALNHFGSQWVLVTNVAYNKIGSEFASIDYILTLTRGFNSKWSGFIENQGYMGDYYSDGLFRMGAAYLFNKDMQKDTVVNNITSTLFSPDKNKAVKKEINSLYINNIDFIQEYGGYIDIGLYDTMEDMLCALLGALLFIIKELAEP